MREIHLPLRQRRRGAARAILYLYWKKDGKTKSRYVGRIGLRRARETAKVEAIALKISGQGGRERIKQCSIIDAKS